MSTFRPLTAFGLICLALVSGVSQPARAVEPANADAVDYIRQVKPLLAQRCVTCHGPLKQEGGLRLDAAALMKKGGDSGTALVPKDAAKSSLIDAVAGRNGFDGDRRMPKDAAPLTADEIALLTRWVEQGAPSPADEKVAAGPADHWAYQLPKRPAVPVVKNAAWVRNPIDAFIAADHEMHGLTPAREAPKYVLLRRLHLDLVGLPPSPEELKAFLADPSPDAYAKAVDRLLDSPHYGERWGRHWMDVWRYSDWYGYGAELRNSSRHIWRWRDWIVDSLNADKPYDRMIVEMLAADELDPGNPDALRATGFLTRQYFKFNRNIWLENTIEHTSKAFLGVTMNCARCHEHKYDPISMPEFYSLRAIFEPYQVRTDRLADANLEKEGLDLAYDAALKTETFVFDRGNEATPLKDKLMEPAVPAALGKAPFAVTPIDLPPTQWYPALRPEVQKALLAEAEAKLATAVASKGTAEATLAAARTELAAVRKRLEGVVAIAEIPGVDPERPRAGSNEEKSDPTKTSKPEPVLVDDFAKANDKVWMRKAGQWEYSNGRLLQKDPAGAFQSIETLTMLPRDVSIELKYRTTGGGQYKSVGISFDQSADGTFDAVYTSVGGGKIQVMTSRAGTMSYPLDGAKPFAGEVGKDVTLRLDLRDTVLNVSLDGKFVLAYRLPERREGKLALWTYDATAEFLSLKVERLPTTAKLVEPSAAPTSTPGTAPAVPSEQTLSTAEANASDAEISLKLAAKRIEHATLARDSVAARIAADNAKFAAPAGSAPAGGTVEPSKAAELANAAVRVQRDEAVATAEVNLLQAELDQTSLLRAAVAAPADAAKKKAADEAPKKLDAAKQALVAAVAERDKPLDANYAPLGPVYPQQSTGRRLALARWIADRNNPLTARVAVNHLWMRHFGQPLVPTVFDFGLNGQPPTHPELLDWLACELVGEGSGVGIQDSGKGNADGGNGAAAPNAIPVATASSKSLAGSRSSEGQAGAWRMKRLHRLMVLSSAYRMDSAEGPVVGVQDSGKKQSAPDAAPAPSTLNPQPSTSVARPASLNPQSSSDPDNRHYTRMNARRMEAEIVRDSLLAVVGNLDPARGGPELPETAGLTSYRRSLYYRHAPEKFMTFLEVFDAANTTECYRRIETVIPQQALALVNSQLAIEQARRFAGKLTVETKANGGEPAKAAPNNGAPNAAAAAQAAATDAAFIARAFETILCRPPTETERAACAQFLSAQSTRLADAKTLTPFSTGAPLTVKAATDPQQRARENLVHVLFNHTEFVTIR